MIDRMAEHNIPVTGGQTVLCVDNNRQRLSSLQLAFRGKGFEVLTAESSECGLNLMEHGGVDLVISDIDTPEMNGFRFLEVVRARWPDVIRVLLTGRTDSHSVIDAVNHGQIQHFISKTWDENDVVLIVRNALARKGIEEEKIRTELLTIQQNEMLKTLNIDLEAKVNACSTEISEVKVLLHDANEKLKVGFMSLIKVFCSLIDMRGGNLGGHSRRVADLSRRIALKLQIEGNQLQEIFVAGLLHEMGKVSFSDELLNLPVAMMKLSQIEVYRRHAVQTQELLLQLSDLRGAAEIIGAQFERFDGTGFPRQRAKETIPIGARILTLASDYDNMQIGTLERRHLNAEDARRSILQSSGAFYDPKVVAAFFDVIGALPKEEIDPERFRDVPVSPNQLQAGMVLSRDLISSSGLPMIAVGDMLDETKIRKILKFERFCEPHITVHIRIARLG